MGLIVGASFPDRVQENMLGMVKFRNPLWMGFPGVLSVLPQGDNVTYLDYNKDLNSLNDSDVDYYLLEVSNRPDQEFIEWAQTVDRRKIIVGGPGVVLFGDMYEPYTFKGVYGKCDDIWKTIEQDGWLVKGVSEFQNMPRYDLYKNYNKLISSDIPVKRTYGMWTSAGCHHSCDFCFLSHRLCKDPVFLEKPLDYIDKESKMMQKLFGTNELSFIYDPNPTQSPYWREKIKILNKNEWVESHSMFASTDSITEDDIVFMGKNRVSCVYIGVEELTKHYRKNDRLNEIVPLLFKNNIASTISYIVDPFALKEEYLRNGNIDETKELILLKLMAIRPVTAAFNILRHFPGTIATKKLEMDNPELAKKLVAASRLNKSDAYILRVVFEDDELGDKLLDELHDFHFEYFKSDFYFNEVLPLFSSDQKFVIELQREAEYLSRIGDDRERTR